MNQLNSPAENTLNWRDYLFVASQYILPHHLLSLLMYWLTRSRWIPLKDLLIRQVIRWFKVDMSDARNPDPTVYRSFNEFFTRPLRDNARPVADEPDTLVCPADGALSQYGDIKGGRIFQAKGQDYDLIELLGGDTAWSNRFQGGSFATIYLSPRDYHRVHMPLAGTLEKMIHVPGRLFSVNPVTTQLVPSLFARNERVVSLFDTATGPMAVILVGAIFVASIDTVWAGTVAPAYRRISSWNYLNADKPITLERGTEMGRFNMGSTVILLFGPKAVGWRDSLFTGTPLRLGETLGRMN